MQHDVGQDSAVRNLQTCTGVLSLSAKPGATHTQAHGHTICHTETCTNKCTVHTCGNLLTATTHMQKHALTHARAEASVALYPGDVCRAPLHFDSNTDWSLCLFICLPLSSLLFMKLWLSFHCLKVQNSQNVTLFVLSTKSQLACKKCQMQKVGWNQMRFCEFQSQQVCRLNTEYILQVCAECWDDTR